jgi:hypothetical protein
MGDDETVLNGLCNYNCYGLPEPASNLDSLVNSPSLSKPTESTKTLFQTLNEYKKFTQEFHNCTFTK